MLMILTGDCREMLKTLSDASVHCCVTSPPYWGLRDYGVAGQLGLEPTPEAYVQTMVEVFREVRRALREDGTLWLNLGSSYSSGGRETQCAPTLRTIGNDDASGKQAYLQNFAVRPGNVDGYKPKDMIPIPWLVAIALQRDGWYLRSDIIWHKPNPMPESVTDRPTKAHEYVFLFTKSAAYFYDAEAIKEPCEPESWHNSDFRRPRNSKIHPNIGTGERNARSATRNKRTVWTIPTAPYPEAHFATYPPDLVKPCILAGTSARGCCPKCGAPWDRLVQVDRVPMDEYDGKYAAQDNRSRNLQRSLKANRNRRGDHDNPFPVPKTTGWRPTCECYCRESELTLDKPELFQHWPTSPCTVLDPFGGSGTTGAVALELGRSAILIELNAEYVKLAERRCAITPGLLL